MPHTPPYAGVDVEPVEKPSTEDDEDATSRGLDTEVVVEERQQRKTSQGTKKTLLSTRDGAGAGNHEEPLLLMPAASNTLDTLFGEVSDSDSGGVVVNRSAVNSSDVVSAANKGHPSTPAKVGLSSATAKIVSVDIEDGEITDSDSEQAETVLPSNVGSVANKENAEVGARLAAVKAGAGRSDRKPPNANQAKQSGQSDREKAPKTACRTPPRSRASREQDRSPRAARKSRSGSDTRRGIGERRRSSPPPRKPAAADRADRRRDAERESPPERSGDRRIGSGARRPERRQLSPRKNAGRPRTVSAKFPFRSRRNSVARFARRTPRRF